MQATLGKVHSLRVRKNADFKCLHPIEKGSAWIGTIGIQIGERTCYARGIPLLAVCDACMAADTNIEINHQRELDRGCRV
jgi:hypothetical protein